MQRAAPAIHLVSARELSEFLDWFALAAFFQGTRLARTQRVEP